MAATVWKGFLTFGLISIPLRLHSAARSKRVEFHQLHTPDLTRVKQQLYCPADERVVDRSEIVKGYETEKDRWIVVEDEEVRKVAPPSSETMEILQVVQLEEVDPIYFETSYYSVPEPPGRKAYSLLFQSMKSGGLAAIAKLAMHRREYTVVIRPYRNGLALHTIYYADEVRGVEEYENLETVRVTSREVQLAEQLLQNLQAPFKIEAYHDEYRERLGRLVKAKANGKTIRAAKPRKMAPVIDLMQALEKSLKRHPQQEKRPRRTTAHTKVRKAG